MVDQIDVDKLKDEAVSAIDILFGDDDDDSFGEDDFGTSSSEPEQLPDDIDQEEDLIEEELLEEVTQQEDIEDPDLLAEDLALELEASQEEPEPATFQEELGLDTSQEELQPEDSQLGDLQLEDSQLEDSKHEDIHKKYLLEESSVNFETLKEDLLTIDWEYSDERINSFLNNLDELLKIHTDKYSQTLLKMIRSVIRYLDKAREKAYPETMVVLPGIIKILQEIHSDDYNTQEIVPKVKSSYQELLALRNSISQYNQYVRKEGKPEPQKAPVQQQAPATGVNPELLTAVQNLEQRVVTLENENKELRLAITDLEQKTLQAAPVTELDLGQAPPAPVQEQPSVQEQATDLEDISPAFSMFENESDISLTSGDAQPEPVVPLEDSASDDQQPASLIEDITFDQPEELSAEDITFGQSDDDLPDLSFGQSVTEAPAPSDNEGEVILAGDIQYETVEIISANEITYGDSQAAFEDKEMVAFESASEDNIAFESVPEEDISFEPVAEESIELPAIPDQELEYETTPDVEEVEYKTDIDGNIPPINELEDEAHYVHCCMLDDEIIAFPEDAINNIYRLPFKLAQGIYDNQTISLKELSSGLFTSLSKNMKGTLSGKSNKELKKMTAQVKLLKEDTVDYAYGILCYCDNSENLIVIPVSDTLDNTIEEIIETKQLENSFSETVVNIEDLGTIPLIDPCR